MGARTPYRISAFNRALLSTTLSIFFLFALSLLHSSSPDGVSSTIIQNFSKRLLRDAVSTTDGCIKIKDCADKCECAKQNSNSPAEQCRYDANFLNYLEFHYCMMAGLAPLSFVVLVLHPTSKFIPSNIFSPKGVWLLVLIYLLITTTEQYFCPSLSKLSKRLRLSNNIAVS